jgi:hypothetical protein
MDVRVKGWIEESQEHAEKHNFAYAIWLVENAIDLTSEEYVRQLAEFTFKISELDLREESLRCDLIIDRIERLLVDSRDLLPEEWMLIVSDLSSCYAIYRFIKRMSYLVALPRLDSVVTKLMAETDEFALASFRCQLDEARSRYPNPLPPPL